MAFVTVTREVYANGELVNDQTFVSDLTEVSEVGSLPFEVGGFALMGGVTMEVTFRFDPPLIVPPSPDA